MARGLRESVEVLHVALGQVVQVRQLERHPRRQLSQCILMIEDVLHDQVRLRMRHILTVSQHTIVTDHLDPNQVVPS